MVSLTDQDKIRDIGDKHDRIREQLSHGNNFRRRSTNSSANEWGQGSRNLGSSSL